MIEIACIAKAKSCRILSDSLAHLQVEVNLLTGETRILAVDLIYDSGKSINVAVDIGQVNESSPFLT